MTFIENKIKDFALFYLRHKKKYIYNMVMGHLITTLKACIINTIPDLMQLGIVLIRYYRLIVFTKIVLDQIPILNFYDWPYSIIRIICRPYTRFWARYLPKLKIGRSIVDISFYIGLEFLDQLSRVFLYLKIVSINYAQN